MNQLIADKTAADEPAQRRDAARYVARFAEGDADFDAAVALRGRVFRAGACDLDAFDDVCRHMVVERVHDGAIVATFRLLSLSSGAEIARSYSAQFYGLDGLARYGAPMIELGRFCVAPEVSDPDVLRASWGALARCVDAGGVQMLFGCSSFAGVDAEHYRDAFALLRMRFLAPEQWAVGVKAPDVVRFSQLTPDRERALRAMPPLLRSYLTMGGWVSDHAVRDRDLGTLHVFTGLEIAAIPKARARAIRSAAV